MIESYAWTVDTGADRPGPVLVLAVPVTVPDVYARVGPAVEQTVRVRVRAGLLNAGETYPRTDFHLYQLGAQRACPAADLASAVAIARLTDFSLEYTHFGGIAFVAEVGIDGVLRPVNGVDEAVETAASLGFAMVVVAAANGADLAATERIVVVGAQTLADVLAWLRGTTTLPTGPPPVLG
ncbi:hypothetical protein [Nocardia brasiliensis]|uniref:hypothetical protein n=1 Tax=Nocardia brasiliensis TaxID=37326 RepID=UPI003D939785